MSHFWTEDVLPLEGAPPSAPGSAAPLRGPRRLAAEAAHGQFAHWEVLKQVFCDKKRSWKRVWHNSANFLWKGYTFIYWITKNSKAYYLKTSKNSYTFFAGSQNKIFWLDTKLEDSFRIFLQRSSRRQPLALSPQRELGKKWIPTCDPRLWYTRVWA